MSTKKVVLEIDQVGSYAGNPLRANLSVLDDSGAGHGYRLFGPKFNGAPGKTLRTYPLSERDRREVRALLDEVDGPLVASEEAIEAASKAMIAAAPQLHPDEDPEAYQTWDEMSEDDREICRGLAKATLEAALPLLKYEVPE